MEVLPRAELTIVVSRNEARGPALPPGPSAPILRHLWRTRVRPVWRDVQWLVLAGLAVCALVLGTIGFHQPHGGGPGSPFWDALYESLQLFGLNSGYVGDGVPLALDVARFLAPAVAAYAAVAALGALFRDQMQLIKVRVFSRNHTVVAGLGTMGSMLSEGVFESGGQLVVVESNPAPVQWAGGRGAGVAEIRALGVPVIVGDATDRDVLRRAGIRRARNVIVTSGSDGTNLDIALTAGAALRTGSDVSMVVHLDEIALLRLMQAEALARPERFAARIEFFNVFETAARLLIHEHPPVSRLGNGALRPHVVFVGLDGIGESLLVHCAGQWRRTASATGRLRATVVGPAVEVGLAAALSRYPELGDILELSARDVDVGAIPLATGDILEKRVDDTITSVYVSLIPAAKGLAAALALRASGEVDGAPIVVAVGNEAGGVASAIRAGGNVMPDVHAFGVFSTTLTTELIFRGAREIVAREMHESHLRTEAAQDGPHDPVTDRRWEEIPETYKEESRRFADGIAAKLAVVECAIAPNPLAQTHNGPFFSPEEVERLAMMEHERWCEEKRRTGWRLGPVKSEERKEHPMLIPWEQLSHEDREKDRDPVRELPDMLAHAGFEIYRVGASAPVEAPAHLVRP